MRLLLGVSLLLVLGSACGHAATINLTSGQSVQTAIDGASTGDVIVCGPGSYFGHIDFKGKAITLRSTNPDDPAVVATTSLSTFHSTQVVAFHSGEKTSSVISGFTIEQGTHGGAGGGGGIECVASSPTITNNYVRGNWAERGGGVYCENASPLIEGNDFDSNSAYDGGGIYCKASSPVIRGNRFRDNYVDVGHDGGAICCVQGSAPQVANNLFDRNHAGNRGGGIACLSSPAVIANCTFAINNATRGGAVCGLGTLLPSVRNCIVAKSSAGGGIALPEGSSPSLAYCDVWGNVGGNYLGLGNRTGIDGNLSVDPRFVPSGTSLYRLQSTSGHWEAGEKWVLDEVNSPCLDAGDPLAGFALEPAPNGGRLNMGFDGNTPRASKTPSNRPTVVKWWPKGPGALGTAAVVVSFSMPMDHESAQHNFAVFPVVAGTFSWSGNKLRFAPDGQWAAGQQYRITIKAGARSASAMTMGTAFVWRFTTQAAGAPVAVTASAQSTAQGAQLVVNLAAAATVRAAILNLAGREVAALPAQALPAGMSALLWDGRSSLRTPVPVGQYLVRITATASDGSCASCVTTLTR